MTDPETNIHVLDAAYKPFPTFAEWAARTTVDTVRWDRYLAELKSRPAASSDTLHGAYEVVKRAAALDTGAIEGLYEVDRGFTFTIALQTTAWELELAKKGEHVRSLFEAQMHAYDYVLDLATKAEPISEAAIRALHEVVCQAQDTYRVQTSIGFQQQTLPKGQYKVLPNHVLHTRVGTMHSYAPVDVTPVEMARLIAEMRTEAFLAAHPVQQAAYAHYGLVVIHPFADGNGRVARALASAFTYRAISMPIMILSEHKSAYLDALEVADEGNYQQFVDFMLARSLDTITLVRESMFGAVPSSEQAAAAINRLFITKGGYTQDQVDEAGTRLLDLLREELQRVISKHSGPNLRGSASYAILGGIKTVPGSGHRLPAREENVSKFLRIEFTSAPPAQARLERTYSLWLPADAGSDDDIHVVSVSEGFHPDSASAESVFSARMDELVPSISGVLQIRVGLLAERLVSDLLVDLMILAKKALRPSTG